MDNLHTVLHSLEKEHKLSMNSSKKKKRAFRFDGQTLRNLDSRLKCLTSKMQCLLNFNNFLSGCFYRFDDIWCQKVFFNAISKAF